HTRWRPHPVRTHWVMRPCSALPMTGAQTSAAAERWQASAVTRVAAIDCGTNSIRLLITDVTSQGGLHELLRTMEFVRLGQDVDRTGMIDPRALGRTLSAVRGFAATCVHHNVAARRFI